MYQPKPINTSHISLPESITPLVERLAEHNPDVWAQRRLAEGWSWGPERNDAAKKHPDLVPYAQLPESEREYDRDAAAQAIKAILALGYRVEKG